MKKGDEKLISFMYSPNNEWVTPIIPASKALPDWYKRLPLRTDDQNVWEPATVKGCMPFFDGMTQGYIIPLWADVQVNVHNDPETDLPAPTFTWSEGGDKLLDSHGAVQTEGMPAMEKSLGHNGAFKLMSPWLIRTPPGYSTLFISPLNNSHPNINLISAIVSTDTYINNINFPFIWTGPEDGNEIIKQGTPVVQVIPFKRDNFTHEIRAYNFKEENEYQSQIKALASAFTHVYKRLWRKPSRSV